MWFTQSIFISLSCVSLLMWLSDEVKKEAPGVAHDHAALDALERVVAVVAVLVVRVHVRVHKCDLAQLADVTSWQFWLLRWRVRITRVRAATITLIALAVGPICAGDDGLLHSYDRSGLLQLGVFWFAAHSTVNTGAVSSRTQTVEFPLNFVCATLPAAFATSVSAAASSRLILMLAVPL